MKRLLLVDDSPVSRRMLKGCLPSDQGFEVHEAGNGREGVEQYTKIRPDLTFMDLTMPEMDGVEAIQQIKNIDAGALIVVCTADVQIKSIEKVLSLGAISVVRKPPKKESILDVIEKARTIIEEKAKNNGEA